MSDLVYTLAELQRELKCGRHTALQLANEIGVRLSPRRIVIPRVRLERWLAGEVEPQQVDREPQRVDPEAAR